MIKKLSTIPLDAVEVDRFEESIDDDLILIKNIDNVPFFDCLYKSDAAVAMLCLRGQVEGSVDLKKVSLTTNDFMILLPGQTVQYTNKSDDFDAITILASQQFINNSEFSPKESISIFFYLRENPILHLNEEEKCFMIECHQMLRKISGMKENPQRMMMLQLLAKTFFYGTYGFLQIKDSGPELKSKGEIQFNAFYQLLEKHFKESREVSFYAEKLYLTPKHLSTVVKDLTGKSASEWIDDRVILEAKALLRSNPLSIQQISEELNFPSQSFFGKFFKRKTGLSPKEFRQS